MKNKDFWVKLIPILLSSFTAWFYVMTYTPLAYMYNDFPGQENVVVLIAVLPGIIAMIGGFAVGGLVHVMSKKTVVVGSIVLSIVGGLIVRYTGDHSLTLAIIGSSLTGFAAGSIPAVNYAIMAEIAPKNMRDKVCGWSDAICTAGILVSTFLAGFLAADGNWTRAFDVYYILVPVLVLVFIFYPNTKSVPSETLEKAKATPDVENVKMNTENSFPKILIGLVVIKFLSALFYMAMAFNVSPYIINELKMGSSALVGTATTFATIMTIIGSSLVFVWMRIFKGASTLVAALIIGVFSLFVVMFPTVPGIIISWMLLSVGMNSHHSSYGSVLAMAPKGRAVGIATGLFFGATFVGEALCAYVTPWMANLIFGTSLPSTNIKTGGILCIVIAFISYPFFKKTYKLAFPKASESEAQATVHL
ncbi:MFS transporter [Neobacillus sp. 179-J 1A1 HS]|uniref:MFS transporter n=1 Tax=Neobacillus driksii TaxID=3035913 RepID=UPI0035BBDE7D